jgi:mRNA-degrading endonuclease toxin of MazEF toxin-antitoxin module
MTEPLQGEIYFWPAIKDNHPMGDKKVHRWVVVSRDAFNEKSSHVLACPLTSHPPTAIDVAVKATPHNRLDYDSALLPRMITPILKEELGKPIARLPKAETSQVLDRIRMIIEVR